VWLASKGSQSLPATRFSVATTSPLSTPGQKDSNTIYGDFLRSRGEGVFHLGFRVDDIESAEQEAKHQGLGILSSGRRADGSGFTYFDTASELGVTLLLRQSPPLSE